MYFLGCDLGSTAGKAVVLEARAEGLAVASWAIEPSGFSPDETAALVASQAFERVRGNDAEGSRLEAAELAGAVEGLGVVARCCTGYGRENVESIPYNVSEITCHARGARFLLPTARTIIDVGGQDVKVIALGERGRVLEVGCKCNRNTAQVTATVALSCAKQGGFRCV